MGVGLVGAGRIAQLHAAALRELGVPLVGVVSSTPARSAEAAVRLGAERGFDRLDDLLEDPRVDAVHIATPTADHAGQVERALRAGKHVVCEKPLTADSAHSRRLAQIAEEAGLVGAVAYTYRYHPVARAMQARVRTLGRLLLLRCGYLQEWLLDAAPDQWRLDPERNGPSRALADIGSHAVDLIEFVTGDRVRAVSATVRDVLSSTAHADGDDLVVVSLELDGGAVGSLELSQVAIGHQNTLTLEVNGEMGSVAIDLRDPTRMWEATRAGEPGLRTLDDADDGSDGRTAPPGSDSDYVRAYVSFLGDARRAMAGSEPPRLPTFRDCVRSHVIRDAIGRSARERSWVELPSVSGAAPDRSQPSPIRRVLCR